MSEVCGLTTEQGLLKLCDEIEKVIDEYYRDLRTQPGSLLLSYLRKTSSPFSILSFLCVVSISIFLFITAAIASDERFSSGSSAWFVIEGIFLLASTAFTLVVIYIGLRKSAAVHSTVLKQNLLKEMYACMQSDYWTDDCYPNLHAPSSPCISLQWCIRNGSLINLPKCLLVKDDVIVMRPGSLAPDICKSLESGKVLQQDEMYLTELLSIEGSGPQPRIPLNTEKFLLQETPFLKNLRVMLDDKIKRPLSFLENERIAVSSVWVERRITPLALVLFFVINAVRYFCINQEGAHWTEFLIILQVHGILPLVAVVFPFLWLCVNTYGQAHLIAVCDVYRSLSNNPESIDSLGSGSSISVQDAHPSTLYKQVFKHFLAMIFGSQPVQDTGFDMLHTFGSITSFCCIDKKGILSWPNASAEKIFFFSSNDKMSSFKEEVGDVKVEKKGHHMRKKAKTKIERNQKSRIEVLDLTHETGKDATGIEFDDPRWKDHLSSLKPLGLASLLNTCSKETVEWYTKFTDHVCVTARENEETVAVVNRRCMCPFTQEIGFTKDAVKIFNHEATFGVYRQVPQEESQKEKVNRARSFIQHKIPMPNQVSVLVRDKLSGMGQLLTQGTGDIVLDCCCDVWNGTDLQILTEADRKKVLDFYHRNSMIAYCTAFAYKPIPKPLSGWSSEEYTELMESPSTTKQAHGEDMGIFLDHDLHEVSTKPRSHSMDSLIELSPTVSMEDVGVGQMLQSHQTFIGMVSLQYQARQEFVQMIDKLESACIRFVYFSKENEVRSRIFSEKLGLEAGWNCHVSLMPRESMASASSSCRNLPSLSNINNVGDGDAAGDHGKSQEPATASLCVSSPQCVPRTHSAPSFVNTEEIQVKFATDPLPIVIHERDHPSPVSSNFPDILEDEKESETQRLIDSHSNAEAKSDQEYLESKKNQNQNYDKKSQDKEKQHLLSQEDNQSWSRDGDSSSSSDYDEDDDEDEDDGDYDLQSTSHYTSSYITEYTEDSLTGALDNRAHLPRGIENVRPHLESVDNVPLLVNLFTDCTSQAICEMVKIMQEYGEVVLVLGSSLNMDNTPVFLQADCSVAVEPLMPCVCTSRSKTRHASSDDPSISPIQLASRLISLPCAFQFRTQDNVKFVQLIMEARHYVFAMRNCFYTMLCCVLAVTLVQLLCALVFLPPTMSVQHILWLLIIVIPTLSLSLMANPNEARTMTMATHKNIPHINKQIILEFVIQFSARFIPSIIVAIICFALVLHSFCQNMASPQCSLYDFSSSQTDFNTSLPVRWTEKFQGSLVLAQNIFHFLFVLYLLIASMSMVHWQDQLWQRRPFQNKAWLGTSCLLLVLQFIFSVSDVVARQGIQGDSLPLSSVHPAVWILACVWPVCAVVLNELVKKRAIKLAVRRQKRARLDFDTKLGMNSPF